MNNERIVTALRILSTDAINKAKSGHPGICLGAAPIVNALFSCLSCFGLSMLSNGLLVVKLFCFARLNISFK